MRNERTKKIALCGVLTALAIVFGYIEHLIPLPIGIYGIKLGLSNVCTLITLYLINAKSAFSVTTLRIVACGMLFGSPISFAYSLAGGLFSFLIILTFKKLNKFSIIGISVCGSIAHNIAQICVAVFLFDELKIAFYLPVLILCGTLTGAMIGAISLGVIKALPKSSRTNKH